MNKKIKTLLASFISFFVLTGCFEKGDNHTITVGLSPDYPPFEFQQDNTVVGFDVDLANRIAEKMNKKLVIKDMPLYSLVASLQSKNIDLIISGISPTEERQNLVAFSDIYHKSEMALLFDAKRNLIKDTKDLKGKVVGAQTGSTMETYLDDQKEFPDITVLSQDSNIQLIEHLKIGRIDAILLDFDQAIAFNRVSQDFAYLPIDTGNTYGFAIAMQKKDEALKKEINDILSQLKQDGTIDELKNKWVVKLETQIAEPEVSNTVSDTEPTVPDSETPYEHPATPDQNAIDPPGGGVESDEVMDLQSGTVTQLESSTQENNQPKTDTIAVEQPQ
ncbi:MAG: ABC transporter substrate-binding protein [Candidatus Midichloria mitochondrii]|nr:ABC transporter substrate-binding protein [Candidatus Midichloria mitochondrii]MDJ1288139.1 ABC transporter substrate-binding protein [Candidatus Midichloria mitochondrii]MDJ1298978.1 ABC transporter substrate-binding protein [Candidatus Midichloria mitochondrii]MDJ1313193.1 ABC transporter substrate-binding protein [Candidatus Midichloria mitochondrii]